MGLGLEKVAALHFWARIGGDTPLLPSPCLWLSFWPDKKGRLPSMKLWWKPNLLQQLSAKKHPWLQAWKKARTLLKAFFSTSVFCCVFPPHPLPPLLGYSCISLHGLFAETEQQRSAWKASRNFLAWNQKCAESQKNQNVWTCFPKSIVSIDLQAGGTVVVI